MKKANDRAYYRVRITSKKAYNKGLFIIDVESMPHGPAVWLVVPPQRWKGLLTSSMNQASLLDAWPQLAIRRYYLNTFPLILTHFLPGEIDIIEGVHDQTNNLYTLHTSPGCSLDASKSVCSVAPELLSTLDPSKVFTGTPLSTNCDAAANFNSGCGIEDTDANSYGAGLNDQGGGVFATLWDDDGIRICAFFLSYE